MNLSTTPPSPDPRVGLRPGLYDAGEASWNMRLVSTTPAPAPFNTQFNSDLAFTGNYVIQGNYDGMLVWDVSNPVLPALQRTYFCPASQSDVSVYRNLLFVSGEGQGGRLDCSSMGVPDSVSHDRLRGIRIFDISDITQPKYIANVQTCRGSHTHSVATQPNDPNNVYIYVSGSSAVRSPSELAGCSDLAPDQDPNSARFRIEVIQVPLALPQMAKIVTSPRIFQDLTAAPGRAGGGGGGGAAAGRGGAAAGAAAPAGAAGRAGAAAGGGGGGGGGGGRGGAAAAAPTGPRPGPNQCHDITTFPAAGFAAGACQGYGILLDIRDVQNPRRIYAAADTNFATWHSVTFNNDGTKVILTDEWGGGTAPRCRTTDPLIWGGNAIYSIVGTTLRFESYYKMPAPQTEFENCVAHNGSLIPIPGRDIKAQGWYQGGVSIFDWTDSRNPKEIAYFDRGPVDATRLVTGGSWSAYWYNGLIYSSEIARGLDIFELLPSGLVSQNEIDAAKTVTMEFFNTQHQPRFTWPASFALSGSYVDQLERSNGLPAARIAAVRSELARIQTLSGSSRSTALNWLADGLDGDVAASSDQAKVRLLIDSVRRLATAQ
jgi:hypothetical protein